MAARVSRRSAAKLCLARSELHSLAPVLQVIQENVVGCSRVGNVATLEGCLVRLKRCGVYKVERVAACSVHPAGDGGLDVRLTLEGAAVPVTARDVSDTNPFLAGEEAAYQLSGRAELLALQAALAGTAAGTAAPAGAAPAPQPAGHGLELHAAAGAAWRKKVLLGWAPNLQELLRTKGLSKLLSDLADPARQAEQAAIMGQLPAGAAPHSPRGVWALDSPLASPLASPRYSARQGPAQWQQLQQGPAVQQQAQQHEGPRASEELRCPGPAPPQLQQQAQCGPPRPGPGVAAAEQPPAPHAGQQPSPLQPRAGLPPPRKPHQAEPEAPLQVQHEKPVQHNAAFWATLRKVKTRVGSQQPAEAAQRQDAAGREPAQQQAAEGQAGQQLHLQQHQNEAAMQQPAPQLRAERSAAPWPGQSLQLAPERAAAMQQAPQQVPQQTAALQTPAVKAKQQAGAVQDEQQAAMDRPAALREQAPPRQDELLAHLQRELLTHIERHQSKQLSPTQGQSSNLQAQEQACPQPSLQPPPPDDPGHPAGPSARPVFRLAVTGVGERMTREQLEAYFRARYAATTSATAPDGGEPGDTAWVCFSSREERDRAAREMDGHVLPGGRKIRTSLPTGSLPGTLPSGPQPGPAGAASSPRGGAEGPASAHVKAAGQPAPSATGEVGSPRSICNQPSAAKKQSAGQRVRSPRGCHRGAAAPAGARQPNKEGEHRGPPDMQQPPPPPPAAAAAAAVQPLPLAQAQLQVQPMQFQPMQFCAGRQFGGLAPVAMLPAAAWPHLMQRMLSFPPPGPLHPDPFFTGQIGAPILRPGPFDMAAAWARAMPPPPPPPPPPGACPPLQHFHSGQSTRDAEPMLEESIPSDHSGAAPAHLGRSAGSGGSAGHGRGRPGARQRSRSPGRRAGARRGSPDRRSRSRSRSHCDGRRSHSGNGRSRSRGRSRSPCRRSGGRYDARPRVASRSRSRSRSPQRRRRLDPPPADGPLPLPGGTSLPLWLPPMLRAACQACAFSNRLPFHARLLLPALDEMRGERDCLRGTCLSLRHLCHFLEASGLAEVEVHHDGPWVRSVRPG